MAALTVYQWGGRDGLPSWRPRCLQVQALLAFHGLPFRTVAWDNDDMSPQGELPVVLAPDGEWVGHMGLLPGALRAKLLRGSGRSFIDDELPRDQRDECVVWSDFAEERLHRALMAGWWLDPANAAVVEALFSGALPWPLNIGTLAAMRRRVAKEQLQTRDGHDKLEGGLVRVRLCVSLTCSCRHAACPGV